jgi:hypothetical protein
MMKKKLIFDKLSRCMSIPQIIIPKNYYIKKIFARKSIKVLNDEEVVNSIKLSRCISIIKIYIKGSKDHTM